MSRSKFHQLADYANSKVIGREDVVESIIYAILLKHHVMIVGKHGIAKSLLVDSIFDCLCECNVFKVQMDKFSTNESVFGPIDMLQYKGENAMNKSVLKHQTDGTIIDAHFAYLDEFMDSNGPVRRSLLEVLNERKFTKGGHNDELPLWTTVATTNFSIQEEADLAVLDRFLITERVNPLPHGILRRRMLSAVYEKKEEVAKPEISLDEIVMANDEINRVHVSSYDLIELEKFCSDMVQKLQLPADYVSDRRLVQSVMLLKASAFLRESKEVDMEFDMAPVKKSFLKDRSPEVLAKYENAVSVFVTEYVESKGWVKVSRNVEEQGDLFATVLEKYLEVIEENGPDERISNLFRQTFYDLVILKELVSEESFNRTPADSIKDLAFEIQTALDSITEKSIGAIELPAE